MNRLWILLPAMLITFTAGAQDTIYTTQGKVLTGTIRTRSKFSVRYVPSDSKDSSRRFVHGSAVDRIVYDDGEIWYPRSREAQLAYERKRDRKHRAKAQPYTSGGHPNVITAQFPQFYSVGGLIGLSGGLGYERYLGKRGLLSLAVPLYYHRGTNGTSSDIDNWESDYETSEDFTMMPGIHYHPFGNKRRNDLSIGVSCIGGVVTVYEHLKHRGTTYPTTSATIGIFGFMGNLIYRVHIGGHGVFGLQVGYGSITSRSPIGDPSMFLLGMMVGGRF